MAKYYMVLESGKKKIVPYSAIGGDKNYVLDVTIPSDTWIIVHDLSKKPAVQVFDTLQNQIEGEVKHNTDNMVTITFNTAIAGTAVFN